MRLGVNVDHVATVRNARGEPYPDPIHAAVYAEEGGADNITCHLREDRRHIVDRDIRLIKETIKVPLNFEIAATDEMIRIALETRPHAVTLVPEKRQELTTEGGIDMNSAKADLRKHVNALKEANILVDLFLEPDVRAIDAAKELNVDGVELHTGTFCNEFARAKSFQEKYTLLDPLRDAAKHTRDLGLGLHVGHGLNYQNACWMQLVEGIEEANIGHAIIARALFTGLKEAVSEMKRHLNDPNMKPFIP